MGDVRRQRRPAGRAPGRDDFLTGAADERPLTERIAARMTRPALSVAGDLSFPEFAALIEAADLAITNNTGPVGMQTEPFGGLGDIPYRDLHRRVAEYRFLFSPMRYTSLPLAVIEGLTIGMPVVALATTELPTVIENGVTGYVSCNVNALIQGMRHLLADPAEAQRMGRNARALAQDRFSLARFARDWNAAFNLVTGERVASALITRPPSHVAACADTRALPRGHCERQRSNLPPLRPTV